MKKYITIIMIFLLSLSLCSCKYIDGLVNVIVDQIPKEELPVTPNEEKPKVEKLNCPSNVKLDGSTISWDSVKYANSYNLVINDKSYDTKNNYLKLDLKKDTNLKVKIKSIPINSSYLESDYSNIYNFKYTHIWLLLDAPTDLKYDHINNKLSWKPVDNATQYEIKINDDNINEIIEEGFLTTPYKQFTEKIKTIYTVQIRSVSEGFISSEWVEHIIMFGSELVRNPFGTTLKKDKKPTNFVFKNGKVDANKILEYEYIPIGVKEFMYEPKEYYSMAFDFKIIDGLEFVLSTRYIVCLTKGTVVGAAMTFVDSRGEIFKPEKPIVLKLVDDIASNVYRKYYNIDGELTDRVVLNTDGIIKILLTDKELAESSKCSIFEDYMSKLFFRDYLFEFVENEEYMDMKKSYTLKATGLYGPRCAYMDYNFNNKLDEDIILDNIYYDYNGNPVTKESTTNVKPDFIYSYEKSLDDLRYWPDCYKANLKDWEKQRYYISSNEPYKYYIQVYNKNNK